MRIQTPTLKLVVQRDAAISALPLGVLALLRPNTDNPEAFSREFMKLQVPAHFAETMSGLFHLFYWITLLGTFVKLIFNQDSIFSAFEKEFSVKIKGYKKMKMRSSMDIVSIKG